MDIKTQRQTHKKSHFVTEQQSDDDKNWTHILYLIVERYRQKGSHSSILIEKWLYNSL